MSKISIYARHRTIRQNLLPSELAILKIINEHGEIPSKLIATIHYNDSAPGHTRFILLTANKLLDLGLVQVKQDTINYPDHTEYSKVWRITKRGVGVLYCQTDQDPRVSGAKQNQKWTELNYHSIDANFAEANLRADSRIRVERIQQEPWCWRGFPDNKLSKLKPDLFAKTSRVDNGKRNFYHWFIEIDRDTEKPVRILRKCKAYENYLRATKPERKKYWCCGAFPIIVWVVPDEKRKNTLTQHISEAFSEMWEYGFFKVVLREELADFVANYGKNNHETAVRDE
jgi:hypothetical protein